MPPLSHKDPSGNSSGIWNDLRILATQSVGLSQPNPRVACLLITSDGRRFHGHTQQVGGDHAEIQALKLARGAGANLRASTAYVTLEPCSHHGRTPPCCDALIAAGVSKVVVATTDPNPLVAGRGIEQLRAAGIAVELLPPDSDAARASRELNIGFFSRMIRKTPWVRMKMASSLDGITALPNGSSQWITGEAARADGHAWRARACAVLTGIGTVLEDDPMLDVRLVDTPRQPHLVVVDSRLETPLDARLFSPPAFGLSRQILIYTASTDRARTEALQARGATVIALPGQAAGMVAKVDLPAMLQDLGRREVNELHVEAGHKLNGSFIREGLVDECLLYLAPTLLGQGSGVAHFGPLERLGDGLALDFQGVERIGEDLRVLARVRDRASFLNT